MNRVTKWLSMLALVTFVLAMCATNVLAAAGVTLPPTHIVTNDDNSSSGGNTATVFSFNKTTGAAKQAKILKTGGTGIGGGFFAAHDVSITSTHNCIFVIDTASSDIAAFKGPAGHYAKVGNFTASTVSFDADGGALALSKNGKFLYSANSASENISEWAVSTSCKLTHENDYSPNNTADLYGTGFTITPSGKFLLVSAIDYGFVDVMAIQTNGTLKDTGAYYFNTFSQCSSGCYPAGIAVTSDGKALAMGNASVGQNIMFGANISATGKITNQTVISMTSTPQLTNPEVAIVNPTVSGKAQGYMGMAGFGSSDPGGVTVFSLVEGTLANSKVLSATQNTVSPDTYYGTIRRMGTWLVQAGYPNQISAFQIKGTKLGKQVNSTDSQGIGLLSLEVF